MIGFSWRTLFGAFLFSLPSIVVSLAARADEPEFALADIVYLPSEGRLVSDTTLSYQRAGDALYQPNFNVFAGYSGPIYTFSPSLALLEKARRDSYTATEGLRFGLVDGLVVGVSESCADVSDRTHYEQNGFDEIFSGYSRGCDNPTFSATYRLLRQSGLADLPVNLDLFATFAPDLLRSRPYFAPGRARGTAGVTVSRAFDEVSLLGRIGAEWAGRATVKESEGFQTDTTYARPYAALEAQYKLHESVFLMAGASVYGSFVTEEKSGFGPYGSGYVDQRNKIGLSYQPQAAASWLAIPDLLSVSLSYNHSFAGTIRSVPLDQFTIPREYRDNSGDTLSLGIRLQVF